MDYKRHVPEAGCAECPGGNLLFSLPWQFVPEHGFLAWWRGLSGFKGVGNGQR